VVGVVGGVEYPAANAEGGVDGRWLLGGGS
jgi:hypothetical protein